MLVNGGFTTTGGIPTRNIQAGTTVSAVTGGVVTVSPALSAGFTGTPVLFGTIGLWIDSYCVSVQVAGFRALSVTTPLLIWDSISLGAQRPTDVWLYDLMGEYAFGDFVLNLSGDDIHLVTPSILGGFTAPGLSAPAPIGGQGIYFGSGTSSSGGSTAVTSATDMAVIGARIAEMAYNGVEIGGSEFIMQGSICGQNGQAASGTYDGVLIDSTAARVRLIGNQIGTFSATSGQQAYGIRDTGVPQGEIMVMGNDLRGNRWVRQGAPARPSGKAPVTLH